MCSASPSWTNRPPPRDLEPGLYIVSTPIGNLRDVTVRALDTLAGADIVLAEDTRTARTLLDAYGISRPARAYHDHNAAAIRPELIAELEAGATIALTSDAGTPLVSDPGYQLVRAALDAGARVYPVPGPSAALAGLTLAGLPTDRFLFAGFPPPKSTARKAMFGTLAEVSATLILYETGPRLAASLSDMAAVLGDRPAVIARELTKKFEERRAGGLAELAAFYAAEGPPKGEIVVLIAPPNADARVWDDERVDEALRKRLGHLSVKDAAAEIAGASGRAKRDVYARALTVKSE